MKKLFYWLPHLIAALIIIGGGVLVWLKEHGTDAVFGLALVNAIGALALSVAPDGFWIAVGAQ